MKINHIGIWTNQLEEMKMFYFIFFNGKSNEKYVNPAKGFESYFIRFGNNVAIEIMRKTTINTNRKSSPRRIHRTRSYQFFFRKP